MVTLGKAVPVLRVSNAELSVAFYRDRLRFRVEWVHQTESGSPRFVSITRGDTRLFLTEHPEGAAGALVYVYTTEVDKLAAGLRAANVTLEYGPVDQPWGMREIAIVDPDGNHLRFGEKLP